MTLDADNGPQTHEGCVCGHGSYHHAAGTWPTTPINGPCQERGCECPRFDETYKPVAYVIAEIASLAEQAHNAAAQA